MNDYPFIPSNIEIFVMVPMLALIIAQLTFAFFGLMERLKELKNGNLKD